MSGNTKEYQGGIKAILLRVAESTGFTELALCGRARFPGLVEARHRVFIECIDNGYTSGQIGRALGCDGSTVRHAYRKYTAGLATPARKEEPQGRQGNRVGKTLTSAPTQATPALGGRARARPETGSPILG